MKKSFKFLLLAAVLSVNTLGAVGCGGREMQSSIDTTKSQLYVGVIDGGYRANWAEQWGREFEEMHKDTVYEEGKKGVEVIVTPSKAYQLDRCASILTTQEDDICFTEQANYFEFIKNDAVVDISEWVTTPLTEYGENESIKDKMLPSDVAYYGQNEDQYYGVPFYTSFTQINYDVDLFEQYNLFFAAEGQGDAQGFVIDKNTLKGNGPDGKTGIIGGVDYTLDDGLPATYDDFFKLCDKIADDCNMTPLIWPGAVQNYMRYLLGSLAIDAMGYEKAKLTYTFDSKGETIDGLITEIEDGIVTATESIAINKENGWKVRQMKEYLSALEFMHRLITTKNPDGSYKYYVYNDCFGTSIDHTAAQTKFLRSKYVSNSKPIAMLVDGTWWYNEATEIFNMMSGTPGAGQYERRLGLMSLPKATTDEVGVTGTTMLNAWTTAVVVRGNVAESKLRMIRDFFRYVHTDKCLSSFVKDAHGIRPFDYELTGVSETDMSYYARQQYNLYKNANVLNPYDSNHIIRNYLNSIHHNFRSNISGQEYDYVTYAFRDGHTPEEYFNGMVASIRDRWSQFLVGIA